MPGLPGTIYNYVFGRTGFGVGAGNMGFSRPSTLPVDSKYGPRRNVLHNIALYQPNVLITAQSLPAVDLLANGLYFHGTIALGALGPGQSPGNG